MLRGTQSLLAFTVLGSTFLVLTTSAGAGSTSLVVSRTPRCECA